MMQQSTLWDYVPPPAPYPNSAGYKRSGPSQDAAATMDKTGRASDQRARALEILKSFPDGLASYELTAIMQVRNIMPRITELQLMGKVTDSGRRKRNAETGATVTVWMAVWKPAPAG